MKLKRPSLPALSSRQRRTLMFVSASMLAVFALQYCVNAVRAQGNVPAPPVTVVAITQPRGGDARTGIKYDPFTDTVDPAAPNADPSSLINTASTGKIVANPNGQSVNPSLPPLMAGGDGYGVPDVLFGQPIAAPTPLAQAGPAVPGAPAPLPSVQSNTVRYAGRITGNPPIAVLMWGAHVSRVIHWNEQTSEGRVTRITPDYVRFSSGLTLKYNPMPISDDATAQPSPSPTPFASATIAPSPGTPLSFPTFTPSALQPAATPQVMPQGMHTRHVSTHTLPPIPGGKP